MDEVEYCIVRKTNKLAADEIKKLPKGSIPTEVRGRLQQLAPVVVCVDQLNIISPYSK